MTRVVRTLLIANVLAFLLQYAVSGVTNLFAFVPYLVLYRPWTIVTYMFMHGGITHIAFNMIALYFFGPRVEAQMGSRRFTILYFLSGITGAIASFVFAPMSPIIGASAGIFGVMLAYAHFWPHSLVMIYGIIPVPARILVILTTVASLFFGFSGMQSGVAHFGHLGGYAGAFFYMLWLERKKKAFRRELDRVTPEISSKVRRWEGVDLASVHEVNRAEVARILDKIAKSGVPSLTPQERIFLSNFVPWDDQAGGAGSNIQ